MIRNSVVANQFYTGEENALREDIKRFILEGRQKRKAIGILCPHAGYMYSGAVAGEVFSTIILPKNILLLGPNHTGLGARAAIMTEGSWKTPLGLVQINSPLAKAFLSSCPILQEDSKAHQKEHSLEVQIPFIQYLTKDFSIVPLALKHLIFEQCEEIGHKMADVLKKFGEDVLVLASSDMTHYESQASAKAKDEKALEEILKLNPKGLYDVVYRHDISMCGIIATTVMLVIAKDLGAKKAELIKYSTSGDVNKDYSQVVGYAGVIIEN